ncbi:GAF domain-containing protein [Hugenholtzia roseola]|uniref:GAF domain-containing protein n=1 Tax=Hugenholtzia roseola TaxID=1002 RepID=UPI0004187807|nr:GAF domain-containing protein [Hugenholtzia roseola]
MDTNQRDSNRLDTKQALTQSGNTVEESLWIDSQLTKFDNVLRHNYNKPLEDFAEIILTELCCMVSSVRGAFFLIDQENPNIDALAGYACTPDTMSKRRYRVGEGLIGQVVKLREPLYFNDLYQSQVALEASAGAVYAGAMLVSPLVFNDQAYGVIELLFLHDVPKKYRELIQRLCANVAAMLQSIIINARTKKLLEISMRQAEDLRSSEEELRQNLEELEAIQEEVHRTNKEFEQRLQALDQSGLGSIEFEPDGTIISANETFLKAMGYKMEEIKGQHHRLFVGKAYAQSKEYANFWKGLAEGAYLRGEFKRFAKDGSPVFISGAYVPITVGERKERRIWKLITDITYLHDTLQQAGYEIDEYSRIKKMS